MIKLEHSPLPFCRLSKCRLPSAYDYPHIMRSVYIHGKHLRCQSVWVLLRIAITRQARAKKYVREKKQQKALSHCLAAKDAKLYTFSERPATIELISTIFPINNICPVLLWRLLYFNIQVLRVEQGNLHSNNKLVTICQPNGVNNWQVWRQVIIHCGFQPLTRLI